MNYLTKLKWIVAKIIINNLSILVKVMKNWYWNDNNKKWKIYQQ